LGFVIMLLVIWLSEYYFSIYLPYSTDSFYILYFVLKIHNTYESQNCLYVLIVAVQSFLQHHLQII